MEKSFSAKSGVETMLASGLDANERHSAKITFKYANGAHGLQYVKTSKHGAIIKSNDNKKYVQFIGDSITEGTLSYSYTIPAVYDHDYSIIALSGIALQDGAGWYYSSQNQIWSGKLSREDSVGMESAYFTLKSPKNGYWLDEEENLKYTNPVYDVENDHKPDAIVIGIGTNDAYFVTNEVSGVGSQDFKDSYVEFVTKLNTLYPDADIYIIRQFNNVKDNGEGVNLSAKYDAVREATLDAVDELKNTSFADKVNYIDTTSWNVEISDDDVHPSAAGYAALRDLVYEEIKASLQ
ncbi:MAG: hypothetical protein E7404_07585 [Ruminococcaceae bacterium]|nr:hypothetical protein [Oscillospiraceae bacterium]